MTSGCATARRGLALADPVVNLGFSGRLTRATIRSPLTPLFLLAALAAGLVALLTIPREEEPQISVPMVDIIVQANGLKAPDAVELVTKPLEAIVKPIPGVEHVYSQTQDDQAVVTVRFKVGTNEDDAVLRVNDKIRANLDKIPIGIPEPLIVGRGINDVAVVVLTLSPQPAAASRWTDKDLYDVAVKLRTEMTKVDNIGTSYIVGTGPEEIRVEPDPEKLSLFGVTLQQLIAKVRDANREFVAGDVRDAGMTRTLAAGQTLRGVPDIGLLLLTTRDGRPVYVRDVAKVVIGPSTAEDRVWNLTPDRAGLGPRARGEPGAGQARRRQRRGGGARHPATRRIAARPADPARPARAGHPRLRPDGQRQGERAAVPSRPRNRFHRRADRAGGRLARGGGDAGGDPHHHPADAVVRQADGLHDQPRQPVRADLRHRHPGGRRDRRGGEHRPPLGDARSAAPACRRRSRRWPRSATPPWSPR